MSPAVCAADAVLADDGDAPRDTFDDADDGTPREELLLARFVFRSTTVDGDGDCIGVSPFARHGDVYYGLVSPCGRQDHGSIPLARLPAGLPPSFLAVLASLSRSCQRREFGITLRVFATLHTRYE